MEKCKFCQGELEENSTLCPHCGRDNAQQEPEAAPEAVTQEIQEEVPQAEEAPVEEAVQPEEPKAVSAEKTPIEEGKKASPTLIAVAVAAVVILLAALTALVLMGLKGRQNQMEAQPAATVEATQETVVATIPPDGNPDNVTCKGSYTESAEEAQAAADTVVATMGEYTLTNRQLQVYYWREINQQAYQFAMYGYLDPYQGLDTQIYSQTEEGPMTWQHAFLNSALNIWHQEMLLAGSAMKEGVEVSAEDAEQLEAMPELLDEQAVEAGLADAEALIADVVGSNVSLEDYVNFCKNNSLANAYYLARNEALNPTQEELEAYYAENEEAFAQAGMTKELSYVDARHILLSIDDGTTDEDWENCRKKAQEVLDTWLAGEKTEESFAALANEHSTDPGSNTTGGLYEKFTPGTMVAEFNDWCFDESRQPGDYGLVKTQFGYHVMYFVKGYVEENPDWEAYTRDQWANVQLNDMMTKLVEENPMTVEYGNIVLSDINLA